MKQTASITRGNDGTIAITQVEEVPESIIDELVDVFRSHPTIHEEMAQLVHRRLQGLQYTATIGGQTVTGTIPELEELCGDDEEIEAPSPYLGEPDVAYDYEHLETVLEGFVDYIVQDYIDNGKCALTRDQVDEALGLNRALI